ncbi:complex I NDUFA9 subunit family protein [Sphingomonas quercus]|uniref:Complex I NDUFA9 subunit family protein n=1 Tax=Sphingomonas quercus TaxID=2842451 RepID=A0ABS6BHD4_9SPHN|nr:complex I NDUFA9 subunit family protein [Sphingomonas quercus]MBU3077714.1 complex I NDUFA9 subunit family protein [Sphingomonas quercus]
MMAGLVTVFGGGGFLGRYVAQELLRRRARVRIAERRPRDAWFIKPLGALGQTEFVAADVRRREGVIRAVDGSDAVINLVGILSGDFQALHVDGARHVAEAAAIAQAGALVHVSAIGADRESPSAYGRSKGEGEAAVRAAFPGATIVRPSVLFGQEDDFVNRFARMASTMPLVPVIRGGTRFQPAWVKDVAVAIAEAALNPGAYAGRTYELGGPEVLSMAALNRWVAEAIGRHPRVTELPDSLGALMARFGFLPGAPVTWEQWQMLQQDNVVAAGAEGFAAFGIQPSPLAAVAPQWLVKYRRHGRFGQDLAA